jgi:hypothetical protein
MTVRELILKLQEHDPEDKVAVMQGTSYREADTVTKGFLTRETEDPNLAYPNVSTVFISWSPC